MAVKPARCGADPGRMAFDLNAALTHLVEVGGSDLHLKVPSRPSMRTNGQLEPIAGSEPLTMEDTEDAVRHIVGTDDVKLREFQETGEVDLAYSIPGVARF